ncbi:MAG: hydrogenase 4 subunit B [Candidatus Omnitrophica bacterium]|jgi:hydrogenase-4 component B|nr:hydrogenase 4 subunit B [Candidatus Omnitrophota bacterium]
MESPKPPAYAFNIMWLLNNISFHIDFLSVLFLSVLSIVSVPALVYSYGYLKGHYAPMRLFVITVLALLFILSMALVVCVSNLLAFLFAWELMSLVSYFLVVFDHQHHQSVDAGLVYLLMTHVGTAFLAAGFIIIYGYAGSFDFTAVKNCIPLIPLGVKNILFLFFLIGFGTKAGIVPLHIWLPLAHPQAPSHISSIMSGVMIKVAIYGFLRIALGMLGVPQVWWGVSVLFLAGLTCLVGVMYALLERDIKKLLAYSSVENIGIILLGIGASMVLMYKQQNVLAVIACAAGLFHLLNHAVFKGLLFLGAGSVYKATGTRDLEKMGGLIKLMPWTAGFFLVGALAISGIPPFNGFVSEWLILQSLFGAAVSLTGAYKIFFVMMMACLAVTGGLAAACFVRCFGIGFLAMPRSARAQQAAEINLSMKIGMGILAVGILVLSLFASFVWQILNQVAQGIIGTASQPIVDTQNILVSGTLLNMPLIGGVFIGVLLFVYFLIRILAGPSKVTRASTWDCGYYKLTARNEYTATAFSKPFRIAFSFFFLPQRKVEKLRESYYHVKSFKYEVGTIPVFKEYFYLPLVRGFFLAAKRIKLFQMGSVHWYLGYILVMFIGVMVFILTR